LSKVDFMLRFLLKIFWERIVTDSKIAAPIHGGEYFIVTIVRNQFLKVASSHRFHLSDDINYSVVLCLFGLCGTP